MSRYTTRRIAAVAGSAAVLAAVLTGTAVAQPDRGPNSAACEAAKARVTELSGDLESAKRAVTELRDEAAESNLPAVDPDDTQVDPEGAGATPSGLDGALDQLETDGTDDSSGAATQVDPEGPGGIVGNDTPDGAADRSEGSPFDTDEPAVDPDGPDGISSAEQRDIDRAVRVVNRVQRNLDNAEARRDKICAEATPPVANPPVSTPAGNAPVVVCVLRPGTCAEVRLDSQGRLVEIVREIKCDTGQLPAATGSRKGERVTTVSRQVIERHVTSDPGSTTTYLPSDPGTSSSSSTYSGGQVTQVPSGAVDTGDGSSH